jgi:archaellum component FlaG (FlaF/FlaG flagellin family)
VDKILVTLMLIIGGVVCCMVVINAVLPAITQSSGAIADASGKIDDRIRSKIEIIEMSDNVNDIYVWIKNIGASRIQAINTSDIFFGLEGNFARIPYSSTETTKPYWNYAIENGTVWGPTGTVKITIYLESAPSGSYYFKIVLPNGISDQDIYSASIGEQWKISLSHLFALPY